MNTYRRDVRVSAPFDEVWAFHSTEQGLVDLTPDWMGLELASVQGPDGEPNPDVLEAGSVLHASVQPFGVGPRQSWTSRIVRRNEDNGSAYFVDEMEDGPFEHWRHTHRFFADANTTICRDVIEYQLPLGAAGRAAGPLAWVGFEPMFRYRHQKTQELLESDSDTV